MEMASRLGAAPSGLSFGDSAAQAGARPKGMVRLPGIAPGHPPWRGDILLLNHSREKLLARFLGALYGCALFTLGYGEFLIDGTMRLFR